MTPPTPPLAPLAGRPTVDAVMDKFLAVAAAKGLTLYPEQEEAILELFDGKNVILATPTGSGKSLVAAALHFKTLCAGERSVYTCPIKALVNEKFLSLCRDFGPENVGMMTGDASVNLDAPVLCCTAEILANIALGGGPRAAAVKAVIMDEFHYYSDTERGTAWQVPLLTLPGARFLLMSATLGATEFFERELTRVTGAASLTVRSDRRPVPLSFEYSETPLTERVAEVLTQKRAPVYLVHFTQRDAAEAAQDLMSLDVCSKDEKAAIATELERVKFNSPYGKEVKRWLRHGVGVHHAGLLPKYKILVEQLAQKGLLKVICGTDTLGVGINVPIRTVLFTQLWKYDGKKAAVLAVRDFRQIAGRAGRAGFDDRGYVIAQAPAHMIENKRAEEKLAGNPQKLRKLVKARAPEGAVGWDAKTFERLQTAPPEGLTSRFAVSHGMMLLMLGRDGDGCRAMQRLIADSHESANRKKALRDRAWQLFRALIDRKIVSIIPKAERGPVGSGGKLRVNVELQDDFSLHQALSLYLLDTLPLLQRESADYPFDVLTLCEAIVEDPEAILRRQVDRLKTEKMAEMKAAGVEYDERIAKLEEVEHVKPLREFLYDTFNAFAAAHPWVEGENVRPKSIAREMFEGYRSFADYVKDYGLERMEGLLLRHLTQVWKVLAQTVPDSAKTEEVAEMEVYFRELIRGVDASLLEEWERLKNPEWVAVETGGADKPARPASFDVTRDEKAFRRLVRAEIFAQLQRALSWDDEHEAERAVFAAYGEARGRFRLDPEGRSAKHTHFGAVVTDGVVATAAVGELEVAQVLVDAEGANDWEAVFGVAMAASRAENRAVVRLVAVRAIGASAGEVSPME
ncbi:MAG: DEAD/DEAH box helicase [Opitutia bacterium Tous-C4FEB]|nr:MAG: DEAD/DEAH box helicase [Opitutae bacterium Tous-C5TDCM]PAW90931.1 MAG: DEAD/DEAH box helicase [Opitutae bacterium Tous-C4FEB]